MPNIIVAKPGWQTPRTLAKLLRVKRVKNVYRINALRPNRLVNWGRTDFTTPGQVRCLNRPEAIAASSNKLRAFEQFKRNEVPTPVWTTDPAEARRWAEDEKTVYGRSLLSSKGGKGIKLWGPKFDTPIRVEEFNGIRLFTRHWKCDYEARYHVFNGEVIDVQRKMRINPERFARIPEALRKLSYWIRNRSNGWIFARVPDRGGVPTHEGAALAAVSAVRALGLDFGAVDLRIRGDKAVILEVNSAPGLEGTTLAKYQAKIREFFNGR